MKKKYTRKQITEAIAYWEKRLAKGNYRKLGEAGGADGELLRKAAREALDGIERNIKKHVEYDYGMDRVQAGSVARAFFNYIGAEPYGFGARFKEHAHGIGNNSEWTVVRNGRAVGSFWCVDDMFGGVVAGVDVGGEAVDQRKFKYVYVPPEEYVPDGDALTWKELHRIFADAARENPDVRPGEWRVDAARPGGEGPIRDDLVNDVEVWSSNGRRRLTIAHVESLAEKGGGWLSLGDLAKAAEKYAREDPDGAAKLGFGYMRHRGHLSRVFDRDGRHVSGEVCYLERAEFDPDENVFRFGILPAKKAGATPEEGKSPDKSIKDNLMSERYTKKQYTKKQITEAIACWRKQLAEGNYRKIDEAAEDDGLAEAFLEEVAGKLEGEDFDFSDQAALDRRLWDEMRSFRSRRGVKSLKDFSAAVRRKAEKSRLNPALVRAARMISNVFR